MILTIPPSQREAFDAGEPVTVWVAFELPAGPPDAFHDLKFCEQMPDGTYAFYSNHPSHFPDSYRTSGGGVPSPLGPVGTRHAANITLAVDMGNGVSVSVGVLASCTVTDAGTVTQRDGVWGIEGMVVRA